MVSCDKAAKCSMEKDRESQGQGLSHVPGLSSSNKSPAVHSRHSILQPDGYSALFDSPAFATIIRFYDKILRQSEKRMEIQGYG